MVKQSKSESVFRFVVQQKESHDPRSSSYLKDAHALGVTAVSAITCNDLYFVQGNLTLLQLEQLASQLLHDPVTQKVQWREIIPGPVVEQKVRPAGQIIEVALRSGVTDPVAEQILRAAQILGISTLHAASTGQRFVLNGEKLTQEDLLRLASRLLCNPVIQRYAIGEITPAFLSGVESSAHVEMIGLRGLNADQLLQVSLERRAALDLVEMQTIQAYCEAEKRDLTDVEFEMIAQTWSEHCVHKTFKAHISLQGKNPTEIDNLFNQTIKAATRQINAPWVRSAFSDNAGIIDYDGVHEISFKVETHNHPSAIEPFGGANTGIGGVIRDVIGVSARPFAATDVLCFGPADLDFASLPAGVLHPRKIASGVVGGIQDYGNKIGIPTVNGAVLYDPGFTSNPLVFCGCAGIAPLDAHPRHAQDGDHIIVIGGKTGRDGLRGATFSSMTMDAQTGEVAGASVQIGAPIVEKGLVDVTMIARDQKLYTAITDCGAGGLSSAVGEMASEIGGAVQLEQVPLKYPGLAPWEIWLSEAQERMVLAVPDQSLAKLREICDLYEVEMTDIGFFRRTGRLVVCFGENTVLDLENHFLHEGIPQRHLNAVLPEPTSPAGSRGESTLSSKIPFKQVLLKLLSHANIASKEAIIRLYDHEVQGGTIVKPLAGIQMDGPSDACVIRPAETRGNHAVVLSTGINPEYGKIDPYQMAINTIDEALRNAAAVGADPNKIAILDNFCWGDPLNPETLGGLVAAALGCRDGALAYQTPFISGKDSFNNEYLGIDGNRHAIPPTLLISAIGTLPDWQNAVTMDLKAADSRIYLVGLFAPVLGGSHFNLVSGLPSMDGIPACQPQAALSHYHALYSAFQRRLVRSCHDLSEGGLSVAAAEMCIGGRLGMDITLPGGDALRACFGETTSSLLVEVQEKDAAAFESEFKDLHCCCIGSVCAEPVLKIHSEHSILVDVAVDLLARSWKSELN
jgi:phosphoribosylformylglycinamidine synthase subunit PurSL